MTSATPAAGAWETVIGLEVHVQLATRSKLFSGSATRFGAPPNTQANAYDLALPGTLPVMNREALRMAVQFGLAIDADIALRSAFDRKNYFYPDLPKGYQLSQLFHPIVGRGRLTLANEDGTEKVVGVSRAHLEEDAGKSLHEDLAGMTGIDLNRAGTPLLEIVSEPELRSPGEAVAYLKKLHSIVRYLGISDAIMAQGSMRCDVNVSVRPAGETALGTRVEIKNVNSFRFVEKAIGFEARRQRELIEDGGEVRQETRLYDARRNETRAMREKEESNDYRYFPEPDLVPIVIDEDFIAALRAELPELPDAKGKRFKAEYGLGDYEAAVLVADRDLADHFERVTEVCGDAKQAANWVTGNFLAVLNRDNLTVAEAPVAADALGGLIRRILDGTISGAIAKTVFEAMAADGGTADEIIAARNLRQVTDQGELEALVREVIEAHPEPVRQYREGKEQVLGFLVGQAMRRSAGKANPEQVNRLLRELIGS